MRISAYFGKRLHGILSSTHVPTRAPLPLSVCSWLADTVACVDHAHFRHRHRHSHRQRHILELTCGFNNSNNLFPDDIKRLRIWATVSGQSALLGSYSEFRAGKESVVKYLGNVGHNSTATNAKYFKIHNKLEMWANAERDGRPAERRWRPLFNAAKFG